MAKRGRKPKPTPTAPQEAPEVQTEPAPELQDQTEPEPAPEPARTKPKRRYRANPVVLDVGAECPADGCHCTERRVLDTGKETPIPVFHNGHKWPRRVERRVTCRKCGCNYILLTPRGEPLDPSKRPPIAETIATQG